MASSNRWGRAPSPSVCWYCRLWGPPVESRSHQVARGGCWRRHPPGYLRSASFLCQHAMNRFRAQTTHSSPTADCGRLLGGKNFNRTQSDPTDNSQALHPEAAGTCLLPTSARQGYSVRQTDPGARPRRGDSVLYNPGQKQPQRGSRSPASQPSTRPGQRGASPMSRSAPRVPTRADGLPPAGRRWPGHQPFSACFPICEMGSVIVIVTFLRTVL